MIDLSKMSMFNRLANVKKENNYSDQEIIFVLEHVSLNKKRPVFQKVIRPRTKMYQVIT